MRSVAVTGATGFIGWRICERLRDAGSHVVGVVRPESTKPLPDGVTRAVAPLEPTALARVCDRVDTIVHAAGVVRARAPDEYIVVNVNGTRAVLDAARRVGARLIHVSSLTAAGPAPADRPHHESDACAPITAYGSSKLQSESVVRQETSLPWTIVRPAAVYGPRDRQFLPLFQNAKRGIFPRLPNAGRFALTLVHVDDVARAIEMICGRPGLNGETLAIGHPTAVTLDGVLQTLAATFNRRYRPVPVPFALMRLGAWLGVGGLSADRVREARSAGFVCSVDRAAQCLSFHAAFDANDGFRATANWYAANGWM